MAFRFNLEAVLKHRKRLEEAAQREFAEAQDAVDQCLKKIEGMYTRIDEVRVDIANQQDSTGHDKITAIQEMEHFISGHKIRIERLRLEARELLMVAEQKQEALIHAAREKKIMVKLKEKRLQEYKEWLRKLEAKELDDQNMIRQVWRMK
jgi:flagellar protein FliJ